jgi:hypothetical protein
MVKKLFFVFIVLTFSSGYIVAQSIVETSELFRREKENSNSGHLTIVQNQAIDTLINRYITVKRKLFENNGYYGMEGYRIQIYNSSNRNAREESGKVRAEFISKFPDVPSYSLFADPGYFKIRVGDFRSKTEATRFFMLISREFPDAYLVPDFINFPDLNKK